MNNNDKKEFSMVMARIYPGLVADPIATVIVVAPSQTEAEKHAEEEMRPFLGDYPQRLLFTWLGQIEWTGAEATTVFLHTNENGRIK